MNGWNSALKLVWPHLNTEAALFKSTDPVWCCFDPVSTPIPNTEHEVSAWMANKHEPRPDEIRDGGTGSVPH